MENPFVLNNYTNDLQFCNRKKEVKRLRDNLENGRASTLFSIRKMGKTGLISHLFNQNKSSKSIYIDLFSSQNSADFATLLLKNILPVIEGKPERLLRRVREIFSRISPVMELDPVSGQPTFSVKFAGDDAGNRSLEELFTWLASWDGEVWLALDEFQQIVHYADKGMEARLRSMLQFCPCIKPVFLGSQQDMIVSMFSDYGRPFYQSTDMMKLDAIPKEEYIPFIQYHMEAGKRDVPISVMEDWYLRLRGHTWYVQHAMNHLYATRPGKWNDSRYDDFFRKLVLEQEQYFITYRFLLSDLQWKILMAVAREGSVQKIQSKEWLMQHKLGTPSSVAAAVKLLCDRELLVKEPGAYRLMNPYMEYWLKNCWRYGED